MTGTNDVISKFRELPEGSTNQARDELISYLTTAVPYSRNELKDAIGDRLENLYGERNDKKLKRHGKDADDLWYMFGKIHGLENIAFVSDSKLEKLNGDPVGLQIAVNEAKEEPIKAASFDHFLAQYLESLDEYKNQVNKLETYESDRSKLLALPFLMQKRNEYPSPQKGQWQYDLFTEMYGKTFDCFEHLEIDPEKKITYGEHEKYLPKGL